MLLHYPLGAICARLLEENIQIEVNSECITNMYMHFIEAVLLSVKTFYLFDSY